MRWLGALGSSRRAGGKQAPPKIELRLLAGWTVGLKAGDFFGRQHPTVRSRFPPAHLLVPGSLDRIGSNQVSAWRPLFAFQRVLQLPQDRRQFLPNRRDA